MKTVVILIMACANGKTADTANLHITAKAYNSEATCQKVGKQLLQDNENKCSLGLNVSCGTVDIE